MEMPQVLIMENVSAIHSYKDMPNFRKWLLRLEELGYANFWEDINAKNYGIPQNRERTIMVSMLGRDYTYHFPKEFPRELCLKDMLEDEVDEKYYLSEKTLNQIANWKSYENPLDKVLGKESTCPTITTRIAESIDGGMSASMKVVCEDFDKEKSLKEDYKGTFDYAQRDTLRPSLDSRYHEDNEVSGTVLASGNQNGVVIAIKNNTQQGYLLAHEGDGINISGRMEYQRGNVQEGMAQTLKTSCDVGVAVFSETEKQLFTEDGNIKRYINSDIIDKFEEGDMATTTFPNGYGHGTRVHKGESITLNTIDRPSVKQNLRIRKLTGKECYRLMAFQDKDADNVIAAGLPESCLYHTAGDSICVNILVGIMARLFGVSYDNTTELIKKYIGEIKNGNQQTL